MNDSQYLKSIVTDHELIDDSPEVKAALEIKKEVEQLIQNKFSVAIPVIEVAGSKAKGTMIRDHYDLDIVCYFQNDDTEAGNTLEEIYKKIGDILDEKYTVKPKNASWQLSAKDDEGRYLHADVVPGRFIDNTQTDCFLYQNDSDDGKSRLQTNLRTHISHVKDSGLTEAIKLAKYWRHRRGLDKEVKTFILELAVIEILREKTILPLAEQMEHLFTVLRDEIDGVNVEDPANKEGNDLSDSFNEATRKKLTAAAETTLQTLESGGWHAVFPEESKIASVSRESRVSSSTSRSSQPTKLWLND